MLSQEVKIQEEKKDEAFEATKRAKEKIDAHQIRLDLLKEQLHIEGELTKEVFMSLLSEMSQMTKQRQATYHKREETLTYLERLSSSVEKDKVTIKVCENKIALLEKDAQQLSVDLEVKNKEVSMLTTYEDSIDDNALALLKKERTDNDYNQNHIEKHFGLMTQEKLRLEQNEKHYQDQFNQKNEIYKDKEKEYLEMIDHHFESESFFKQCTNRIKERQSLMNDYQAYVHQLEVLSERIKEYEEKCVGIIEEDLSLYNQKYLEYKTKQEETLSKTQQLKTVYDQHVEIIKQLEHDYKKGEKILESYTLYLDLYNQTSGKNTSKLSFERYVLAFYFEHILEFANIELMKMSQGRYELKRKLEGKGNKQQGLDLSVLDYETGVCRDIQSLSGGESFQAALSLALGLSSMIQSYVGG